MQILYPLFLNVFVAYKTLFHFAFGIVEVS